MLAADSVGQTGGIELFTPSQGLQAQALASLLQGKAPQVTVVRIDVRRFFARIVYTSASGIAPVVGQPVVLVGHSMGAAVASIFASLYPERVSALVLIEGLMPGEPSENEFANLLTLHLQYLTSSPRHTPLPNSAAAAQRLQMVMPSLSHEHALRIAERLTQPLELVAPRATTASPAEPGNAVTTPHDKRPGALRRDLVHTVEWFRRGEQKICPVYVSC
ncbi:MAG: alpha/beta hydrolase [Chloroflexota bacterium]|nr:alpha/beta hydrolase [Chloroflexota bacterium]